MPTLTLDLTDGGRTLRLQAEAGPARTLPAEVLRPRPEETDDDRLKAREYGERLFADLFPPGSDLRAWLEALPWDEPLALRLAHEALLAVPWETLHDGEEWLVARLPFVRTLPLSRRPAVAAPEPPVPLLFLPTDPLLYEDRPRPYRLSLPEEWEQLRRLVEERRAAVRLRRVLPPTLARLQEALAGARGALLHFTGHGALKDGKAYLLFEREDGRSHAVEARQFAARVRGRLWLAFLSACQSAAFGATPESNLAARLVRAGVPFALGMQAPVGDEAALHFARFFYRYLLSGEDLYAALHQARLALLDDYPDAVPIPVLYAADPTAPAALPAGAAEPRVEAGVPPVELTALPWPEEGFFGRQRELAQIGAHLTRPPDRADEGIRPRTLTLHGVGGIGKTALLRRAAERFAWAFEGVLGLVFEPLPGLPEVLGRLERFLGLPEAPHLSAEARRERALRAVEGRRLLLALDNLETLVRAKNAEKDPAARDLFDFLAALPVRGPVLLASSREATGLPGEVLLPVSGLEEGAAEAFVLALVKKRRHEATPGAARRLARDVEGHPLALRLLVPLFDDGEGRDLEDFARRARDYLARAARPDALGRRHDALESCFAYSLNYWKKRDPEPVAALARLSLFRGEFVSWLAALLLHGQADEETMPVTERTLHTLWERGLLERRVEPLDERTALTFYRLHPTLRPFARDQLPPAEAGEAEARYVAAVAALAATAYPAAEGHGVWGQPWLAAVARALLPDLEAAAQMRDDAQGSRLRFHAAFLLRHFGDLEGAMRLYQEALEILEALGDQKGKSATLHEMAYIYRVRGNLDQAMRLYQESLRIKEALGDQKGKAVTLGEIAQIEAMRGNLEKALALQQEKLVTLHNKSRIEEMSYPSSLSKRLRHLESQSLPSPTVHDGSHKDKDVIVKLQAVSEAFAQRPKLLHLRQDMFDHDAHTRQLPVHQLVVFRQGMVAPRLVGGGDTMIRQILMQTVKASIGNHPHLLGNPRQDTRLPKVTQIMDRTGGGGGHRANQPLFVHDQTVLHRVLLLLARVERSLAFRIPRPLDGLLRPIQNGKQVGVRAQHIGQILPLPSRRRVRPVDLPLCDLTQHRQNPPPIATHRGLVHPKQRRQGRRRQVEPHPHHRHQQIGRQVQLVGTPRAYRPLPIRPAQAFSFRFFPSRHEALIQVLKFLTAQTCEGSQCLRTLLQNLIPQHPFSPRLLGVRGVLSLIFVYCATILVEASLKASGTLSRHQPCRGHLGTISTVSSSTEFGSGSRKARMTGWASSAKEMMK